MTIAEINIDQLAEHIAGGGQVLDVRQPDEYAEVHVPGVVLIPLPELQNRVDEVPEGDLLAVICRSGARSMVACEFLVPLGREVVNVAGGTNAWIESGRTASTGSEA